MGCATPTTYGCDNHICLVWLCIPNDVYCIGVGVPDGTPANRSSYIVAVWSPKRTKMLAHMAMPVVIGLIIPGLDEFKLSWVTMPDVYLLTGGGGAPSIGIMDIVQIVDLIASIIIASGVIYGFRIGKQTTNKQTEDRIKETRRRIIKEKWVAVYLLHSFLEQLVAIKNRQSDGVKKFTHMAEKLEDYQWLETQFRTYGHLLGDDLCKEYVGVVKADTFFMRVNQRQGFMSLQKLQDLAATRLKALEESYKELTGVDIKGLNE